MCTYGESLVRVNVYHAPQQVLTVGRHKVRDVKDAALDFLQQLTQVVVVKR